jgi:predicted AlkP superfamily pyrophosphatase or phosphodiesterase
VYKRQAHIYCNDKSKIESVKVLLENHPDIDLVLDKSAQEKYHIQHSRSGDLVCVAKQHAWFTYYYWLDDKKAPDFARMVDIHKKPGYDPVELFTDPKKPFMKLRIIWKILKKKLGFRSLLNVIPLDASLVKGSHGAINIAQDYQPIIITPKTEVKEAIAPTKVFDIIWNEIFN